MPKVLQKKVAESASSGKGISMLYEPPNENRDRADKERISQVDHNIIGNALEFTTEGK